MEHLNILLNFLVILAVVLIAAPDDAGGYRIQNNDEDAPAYPWERVVYRELLPRLQKRNVTDANNIPVGDLTTKVYSVSETKPKKRISGFDENMFELKNYGEVGRICTFQSVDLYGGERARNSTDT